MTPSTRLVALSLTTLLVAATPAIQAPADRSTSPSVDTARTSGHDLPEGVELIGVPTDGLVHVEPRRDLRAVLLDAVDPRDPTDLFSAVSRHVAEAWGTTDLLLTRSDDASPVETAHLIGGTFIDARAPMDTDGDGRDDVVLTVIDAATGATELVALDGVDGREQWRVPVGSWDDALGWPAGDLTGDGVEDLFALDFQYGGYTYDEDCDDDGCTGFDRETFTWELSARSGADGSLLWQEAHPGEYRWDYTDRETEDGSEYSYSLEADDLVSLPYPGADHDGDGGRDILVNTISLTDSYTETYQSSTLGGTREGASELDSTTTARVVRGADGSDLMAALTSRGPSIASLRDAGDATGDGVDDLLWRRTRYGNDTWSCERYAVTELCDDEREPIAPQLELDLLDGSDLSTAWSFEAPVDDWTSYAIPLLEDLDGVPGTDVLLRVAGEDEELDPADPFGFDPPADDLVLLSGQDGTVSWRIANPGYVGLWAIAEMGGATGPDLLLTGWSIRTVFCSSSGPLPGECEEQTTATQNALRFDGTTGELLSDTSRAYDLGDNADYYWFWFSSYAGDHDGDGIIDPRMTVGTNQRSVAMVQSAVTGDVLFEHVGREELLLTFGGGDLDGSGTDELGTYRWETGQSEILRMPSGELLHDLTDIEGELYAGGDQDGTLGDELVRVVHHGDSDGQVHATVESLDGATLAPRWSLPVTAG